MQKNLIDSQPADSALFVYYEGALDDVTGGVQLCSREYFDTLTHAGFSLKTLKIENDRRMTNRVRRKLGPEPYSYDFNSETAIKDIKHKLSDSVRFIFLNQYVLRPLARLIKEELGHNLRTVLLSHGLASVDYLHEVRAACAIYGKQVDEAQANYLGRQLFEEASHAPYIDHVFCLSPVEVEIEKWLGAREVAHVPRIIKEPRLDWQPVRGRIGFVGRIDHPPNREGLVMLLDELGAKDIDFRIVGAPAQEGMKLSESYDFVSYLGELTDEDLREEASTWSVFVHPVFCYAMGCSTKLAVALGWEIPIVTSTMGARGYVWREGSLPMADDSREFAGLAVELSDPEKSMKVKEEVSRVRNSSPTIDEISSMLKTKLKIS